MVTHSPCRASKQGQLVLSVGEEEVVSAQHTPLVGATVDVARVQELEAVVSSLQSENARLLEEVCKRITHAISPLPCCVI